MSKKNEIIITDIANRNINDFRPTNAILINAIDEHSNLRNMALFYNNTDKWFDQPEGYMEAHFKVGHLLGKMVDNDPNLIAYNREYYSLRNGIYTRFVRDLGVFKREN